MRTREELKEVSQHFPAHLSSQFAELSSSPQPGCLPCVLQSLVVRNLLWEGGKKLLAQRPWV